MKKTEQLIAAKDFLSVKGIELERFFSINIDDYKVSLLGKFADLAKPMSSVGDFKLNDSGFVEAEISIPVENQEPFILRIVLT